MKPVLQVFRLGYRRIFDLICVPAAEIPAGGIRERRIRDEESIRLPKWFVSGAKFVLILLVMLGAIAYELRTSTVFSRLASSYASQVTWKVRSGTSENTVFPRGGPFDTRLGYSRIPEFVARLEEKGFYVSEQAAFSARMETLARWGITPPFSEPPGAALKISGLGGMTMYDARPLDRVFQTLDEVPPLILDALIFIENRELNDISRPHKNPVVEWDRLARAGLLYAGFKIGLPVNVEGGSTLATQMEKYRHSSGGRTASGLDKGRQLVSATLKAYSQGTDTSVARRRIILEYLNTVPLAAAPGYGEVHGMGEGLYAWFGSSMLSAREALEHPEPTEEKARAAKQALLLLCAMRAPTFYLLADQQALAARADYYTRMLSEEGVLDPRLALLINQMPVNLRPQKAIPAFSSFAQRRAEHSVRTELARLLGISSSYDLDRLHLEVSSSIDLPLQAKVTEVLSQMSDPVFLRNQGLLQDRLLSQGDPSEVVYSFLLYESTPQGNALRVQADTLNQPFNLNEGMKLELGSTAKLRTLAHYLETVEALFRQYSGLAASGLQDHLQTAEDPLTRWLLSTLAASPRLDLSTVLKRAMERTYSASPEEAFFTGGGLHRFRNFDSKENGLVLTVREATVRSTNLVFIRLMRDLVRYHEARLPYRASAVLNDMDHADRLRLLQEIAAEESRQRMLKAYRAYRKETSGETLERLLGSNRTPRRLAMVFHAWNQGRDEQSLDSWLRQHNVQLSEAEVAGLIRSYGGPHLNLSDFGYLLGVHPLDLWVAGQVAGRPDAPFSELLAESEAAQRVSSEWLFRTRNRRAQDLRLRIRIEQDAFERMTPYWQRLGFPFPSLVPSYATAIGSSADRPSALAELLGIIVNDGTLIPSYSIREIQLGRTTPYETKLQLQPAHNERIIGVEVARALREVLASVVEEGTARRLKGAFRALDGSSLAAGGKTGSGDNRVKTFSRGAQLVSSQAINRTATFVFFIGERHFGVITAFVPGDTAADFRFTSALPVSVLKLTAAEIQPALSTTPVPDTRLPRTAVRLE
jgi:membrane peptidoglycan carboxypeptidase